jgi:hypothetical protein
VHRDRCACRPLLGSPIDLIAIGGDLSSPKRSLFSCGNHRRRRCIYSPRVVLSKASWSKRVSIEEMAGSRSPSNS